MDVLVVAVPVHVLGGDTARALADAGQLACQTDNECLKREDLVVTLGLLDQLGLGDDVELLAGKLDGEDGGRASSPTKQSQYSVHFIPYIPT